MAGWYRRFVSSYATISAPLTNLLKKEKRFVWTNEAEIAFNNLKQALCQAPVLVHPNFKKDFFIQCDASSVGVGSVLFQRDEDGGEHPIAYMSQKLNAAQRNYSVTELECFAAVLSVKKYRAYIDGYFFTIITDHASLQWLMNQKELSGRLARWSLKLQGFNFKIEHCKGSQNIVPDSLSRAFLDEFNHFSEIDNHNSQAAPHVDLKSSAFLSEEYLNLINTIQSKSKSLQNFHIKDGKIFVNLANNHNQHFSDISPWKLYVPKLLIPKLIEQAHDPPLSAHMGIAKTVERLQRYYFWPKMFVEIQNYINQCVTCKQSKAVNYSTQPTMGQQIITTRAMQHLYMDFLGPYPRSKSGNCYILIILDHFSKYVFLKPMRRAISSEVVKYLEKEIFLNYSVPESMLTDNGAQFISNTLKNLLNKFGIKHILTPRYSPQSNASERVNRSILSAIRAYIKEDHQNWDSHLSEITCALRNVVHNSTQFSPHYLLFGQHMVTHGDDYQLLKELDLLEEREMCIQTKTNKLNMNQQFVIKHLRQAHENSATRYNLRSRDRTFEIGQIVYVKNHVLSNAVNKISAKLAPKFIQAKIIRKVGNVAFEIVEMNGKSLGVYHIKDLKS